MNKIYNYIYFYFLFKLKWKLQNRKSMFPPTFDGFSQKNYCSLEEKLVITHYNRTLTIRIVHICPSFHFHSFFRPLRKLLYLSTLQSQRGVSNPPPKRRLNCAILTKKRHLSLGGTFQKGLILGSPTLMIHPFQAEPFPHHRWPSGWTEGGVGLNFNCQMSILYILCVLSWRFYRTLIPETFIHKQSLS